MAPGLSREGHTLPGQDQQTPAFVERDGPDTVRGQDGHGLPPEGDDWEAYSLDILTDLLDS
jgi:hypothetical protein